MQSERSGSTDKPHKRTGRFFAGINNGVLLVRNGDWARDFFAAIASHATAEGLAEMRPVIEAELGPLQTGFFDTPIIVYLLKTQPKYLDRQAACAVGPVTNSICKFF